ncbi:MAG: DUF481 domain-containing protein [Candidatus Hydrogenedentales bacterium]
MPRAMALIALFILGGVATLASADTLNLKNGDQIGGNLVEIADGVLVFRTTLAGQMMVPVSQVVSVSTTSDFVIEFKDGTRSTGRISDKGGALEFVENKSGKAKPLQLADIANAAKVPARSSKGSDLLGFVETGTAYRFGNDNYVALFARLRMGHETDTYYYRGETTFDIADEGRNPRVLRTRHEVTYLPEREVRPLVQVELERDLDEALALRARVTAGVSIALYESERDTLEGQFGLSAMHERYDSDEWRSLDVIPEDGLGRMRARIYGASLDEHDDRDDIGLDLSFRHSRAVFRNSVLEEELRLRPSLTDFDEFASSYESRLSVPLTERLHLKLNMRVDFDSSPQYDYLEEWRAAVGAGISWDF